MTEETKEIIENQRLTQILDSLPCVALLVESRTRNVLECNRHSRDAGVVAGRKCYETIFKSNTPCSWCLAPEMWTTQTERRSVVEACGRIFDVSWIPVSADHYLHFTYDITSHKVKER